MAALKLPSMYIGTDSWPWTIFHASPALRRHSVLRNQTFDSEPSVRFPVRWIRPWQNPTSSPTVTQVSDLIADLASPRGEPVLQPLGVSPDDSQRRCQVELNEVLRLMGYHSSGIFDSHGLRPRVDHRSDPGFGAFDEGNSACIASQQATSPRLPVNL